MKLKAIILCVVALVAFGTCQTVSAGIYSNFLVNGINTLNDNSQGTIVDVNGDNLLNTGDIIYGAFEIEKVNSTSDPSPGGIFAIFSLQITGPPLISAFSGAPTVIPNKPTPFSAGTGFSVRELMDPALGPAAGTFSEVAAASYDNVLFALLENPSMATGGAGTDTSVNPFSAGHTEATAKAIIASTMTAANGWSLDMLGGFSPTALNSFGFADFFHFELVGAVNPDGDGINNEVSDIKTDGSGTQIGKESAGMTILHDNMALIYLANAVTRLDVPGASTNHGIVLKPNGTVQTESAGSQTVQWDVKDDNNFQINIQAVPEPGSMLVWAGLSLAGVVAARRRRKLAA